MKIEPIHPSEFIQDELDARGWTRADLANRMGMDCCVRNKLVLDLYFVVGPEKNNCRLGQDTAEKLSAAFDISAQYFLNLEKTWLKDMAVVSLPVEDA